ncbi:helix-turn-helix domain-containing protein [Aliidiomarina soli]|uniref:Transcriptional regulator n=1 Tax=Aliidiomarina soli TaxID=1928574 RepID=A0A432WE55_9GAMM|nr:helix-turn-helix domain-containing protein [Aliidiomarina soli]RUO31088.1 transcriptional regulator [Aliidiomarina soli]
MRLNTPQDIGAMLRDARKAKSWTQAELASRLGMYQKDVSKAETQPEKLNVAVLLSICAMLDVRLSVGTLGNTKKADLEMDF